MSTCSVDSIFLIVSTVGNPVHILPHFVGEYFRNSLGPDFIFTTTTLILFKWRIVCGIVMHQIV